MSPSAADAEIVFWQTIATSKNPDDFAAYLQQYPDGKFAALAALRVQPPAVAPPTAPPAVPVVVAAIPIARPAPPDVAAGAIGPRATPVVAAPPIMSPAEQARQAEAPPALPPEQRQSVQRGLTGRGPYTGGTAGQVGPRTRHAIARCTAG